MKKGAVSKVDYDNYDTSKMIKTSKPLKLEDLGLRLPNDPPTQINIWTDLEGLVDDQLNLQVKMQFKHHHQFMLNSGLNKCSSVIDLGTGNGTFLHELAKAHPKISFIGVDNQAHMISKTKCVQTDNVKCLIGDVNNPQAIQGIGNVDGVLMRYILLHMNDTSKALSNLHKVLKKNTRLWIIDLDLEHYVCNPPHEAFELIKRLVKRFCDEHGRDSNVGSKLITILKKAGFRSIEQKIEPLNTETVDIAMLQKFIIQEVIVYRAALENAVTDEEFEKIKTFIDELPNSGTSLNYGVTLVSSIK